MKYTASISLLLTAILVTSCLHKNVMNDQADDIITVLEYRQGSKYYLITMESVFQASSKSTNGGITTISGHNDLRLSVYDIETGALLIRKKVGKNIQGKSMVLLGCTPGNLWVYSEDDDLGLHSVDPLTLEMKRTQNELLQANPDLKGNLAVPEYYTVLNFYSFDPVEQKPVLTDMRGYRYSIDPASLKATKLEAETRIFGTKFNDYLSTSIKIDDKYMSMNGTLRKKIQYTGKEYTELDFLAGEFIVDQNFGRIYGIYSDKRMRYGNTFDSLTRITDSIELAFGKDYWYYPKDVSRRYDKMKSYEGELKTKIEEYDRIIESVKSSDYDDCLLQPEPEYFFIAHKHSTNKDAFMCISKIHKQSDTVFKEVWKTVLPNVFFDTSAAQQTDAFKEVFSKGDPEFDFKFFDIIGNKLVIIYALNMVCLDIPTGKVLWQFVI